jgi:hypothetical protein
VFELYRFHHLSQHAITKDNDRNQVFVGKVKGAVGEIGQLLYR